MNTRSSPQIKHYPMLRNTAGLICSRWQKRQSQPASERARSSFLTKRSSLHEPVSRLIFYQGGLRPYGLIRWADMHKSSIAVVSITRIGALVPGKNEARNPRWSLISYSHGKRCKTPWYGTDRTPRGLLAQ